jgi:uncharacterized membrane protein
VKSFKTNIIVDNAIIIALYVALTLITYPISFGPIQFRFAEILVLLCFFRKDYAIGLTLGCVITNIASFSPFDMLFGSLATLLSCLVLMFSKHLLIGMIAPIVFNSFIVGFELYFLLGEPLWFTIGTIAIGEATVIILGYIFFMIMKRRKKFLTFIKANQNLDYKF